MDMLTLAIVLIVVAWAVIVFSDKSVSLEDATEDDTETVSTEDPSPAVTTAPSPLEDEEAKSNWL